MVQIVERRPGGRRGRPPGREDRRAAILRRAADAFRERGFHATGMRDIARTLGMTPGNLYYYFRGKDDLLYECQRRALETLLAGARDAARGPGTCAERLARVVRGHVLCLLVETGGSAAHLEFRALPGRRRAEIARRRDAYEREVRSIVERGVASGEFRRCDAKLATLALLGALNATVTWWRPDGACDPETIARAFSSTLVEGLSLGGRASCRGHAANGGSP